jgi:hypothetical protein
VVEYTCGLLFGGDPGLARLTGDGEQHLQNSSELQRLRLLLLSKVVVELWPSVGKRMKDPFDQLGHVARAGCLGNQLCEWTKAGISNILRQLIAPTLRVCFQLIRDPPEPINHISLYHFTCLHIYIYMCSARCG